LADQLARDGVKLASQPAKLHAPGGGYGFRLFDPDGRVVEVSSDVEGRPYRVLERRESIPARLSHVVFNSPNPLACVEFYQDKLGFKLSGWLGAEAPPIEFVPFGVDVEAFRPRPEITPDIDVVTVGADPRRDFALLLKIAARRPELSFRIEASAEHARTLRDVPANVVVEIDIPLEQVRDRLVRARVVALPVRDNSYSGATTVLLQAMAMAKPVVVSRTAAISEGYELEDGGNCRLVPPGDAAAFERALLEQVTGAGAASDLGTRARQTVERSLSWERYTNALWQVLRGISPRPSG